MKPILFSLEGCTKCDLAKSYLVQNGIEFKELTLSNTMSEWSEAEKAILEECDAVTDLSRTAPVMYYNGKRYLGYLKIKRWVDERRG